MAYLPINALRALEATVRLGAVTRAAEELHVTHSAVSYQLKSLENWFGLALLERRGRGVVPTPDARQLAELVEQCFLKMSDGCERLRRAASQPVLTVACIPSFAAHRLIPLLPQFSETNPDVRVRLVYALSTTDLLLTEADLIVRSHDGPYGGPGIAHRLLSGQVRPICSARFLSRLGPLSDPSDLLRAPLLHDADRTSWTSWFAAAGMHDIDVSSGVVFEDFHLLSTAVLCGQGVGLCPVELLSEELRSGELVQLFELSTHKERAYWLVHRDPCSEPAAVFRDWIIATMAPESGSEPCTLEEPSTH